MKPKKSPHQHHQRQRQRHELGTVWYLIPLGWVAIAVAGFFVLVTWPLMFADPLAASAGTLADAFSPMPHVGSELSVPSASSVFSGVPYQPSEQVEAF